MQKIKAGEMEMEIIGVYGAPAMHQGVMVDSLRVSFPNDISEEELVALLENPWEIYNDAGNLQSVQAGCNYIQEYAVTFLRITDAARLQAQLSAATTQAAQYREALIRAGINPDSV